MSIHIWKSKSRDFLVTLILFFTFMCFVHLFVASRVSRHYPRSYRQTETFQQRLTAPFRIGMTILGSFLAFSPLYVFKRKVPKSISLDEDQQLLIVQKRKRKKLQTIALPGAGYLYYSQPLFAVLEIYHDFETRRGSVRRRYLTILIPKFGMSITDRDLKKLVLLLKENGLPEETGAKKRSWNELIWE